MMSLRPLVAWAAVACTCTGAIAQPIERRITVINSTDTAIEYVYVAACGAGAWGKDRLGAKEIVPPGAKRLFSIPGTIDVCCHDLRVKLQTGASRQKLEADLCREPEWVVR
jgi:hypothetical protein